MNEKDMEKLIEEKLIEEIAEEAVKYYVNWYKGLIAYMEKTDKEMLEKMGKQLKKQELRIIEINPLLSTQRLRTAKQ